MAYESANGVHLKKKNPLCGFPNYRLSVGGGLHQQFPRLVGLFYTILSMMSISQAESIKKALSAARIGTYEAEFSTGSAQLLNALKLYTWNAQISAAMLVPLHLCEVTLRNAASEALTAVYGPAWPWSEGFRKSLPDPSPSYSPRKDLLKTANGKNSTGLVIPELKFVFWQRLFTRKFDNRLWLPHLLKIMPNLDNSRDIMQLRSSIYFDLEVLRKLRNRIAHHEPIFARDLSDDLQKIHGLISSRCRDTAAWMRLNQEVEALILERPLPI